MRERAPSLTHTHNVRFPVLRIHVFQRPIHTLPHVQTNKWKTHPLVLLHTCSLYPLLHVPSNQMHMYTHIHTHTHKHTPMETVTFPRCERGEHNRHKYTKFYEMVPRIRHKHTHPGSILPMMIILSNTHTHTISRMFTWIPVQCTRSSVSN